MERDPCVAIASEPMNYRQVLVVGLVVLCIAVDGFDVFAIAFAAPVIAQDWNVAPAALGLVLSMELVGMGFGAYLVGILADRLGRRTGLLFSLAITASGMWLCSISPEVTSLAGARLYTGLGIGGLLVAGSTLISESTNERNRDMAVAMMVAGYPMGVAIGGLISAGLLASSGRWQAIFEVGAAVTGALLIPIFFLLPESVAFLSRQRSLSAHTRINRILVVYGKPPVAYWQAKAPERTLERSERLVASGISTLSAVLMIAFFFHMMTFYFFMKWIPKLVVDMGHAPATASMVVVWANLAGAAGSLLMSFLSHRRSLRKLVIGAMATGGAAVVVLGQHQNSLVLLSIFAALAGFFTTGGTAGFYALLTRSFSTRVRAVNTGFVLGLGRSGAAAGPVAAGILFTFGWPLGIVAAILGTGSLVAAAFVSRSAWVKQQADPG